MRTKIHSILKFIKVFFSKVGNKHKKGAEETIENYCKSLNLKERKTKKGLLFLNEWAPLRYSGSYIL